MVFPYFGEFFSVISTAIFVFSLIQKFIGLCGINPIEFIFSKLTTASKFKL